jgi:cytochrome c oxidase subunit 2
MKDTSHPDLTIKVTGYQWKWGYDYVNEGFGYLSTLKTSLAEIQNRTNKGDNYLLDVDNPLVVPVGKKVRVLLTANDVIHAWFVPALGVKQSTIPGFVRDTWFMAEKEGIYRGQCAELCGKEHGFMPVVVKVVSEREYTAWVDEQKKKMAAQQDDPNKTWTKEESIARGEKVYSANCAACHQANGKGGNGIMALDGSAVVKGAAAEQMTVLLKGRNNNMPAWAQLSDTELAAVMTYTRNSWTNNTGEVIQPKLFQEHRKTLGL